MQEVDDPECYYRTRPTDASGVVAKYGSNNAASAGSATIPAAILDAVIPTWHTVLSSLR